MALGPPNFQGPPGAHRTPRGVRCSSGPWTLPPADPFPGWAGRKTEKIPLSGAPADVFGLPNVAVNHHVPVQEFYPDSLSEYALTALSDELPPSLRID